MNQQAIGVKFAAAKQRGQGMTEYIIIVALIAVAAIGIYGFFGDTIRGQMTTMTGSLAGNSATTTAGKAAVTAGAAGGATQAAKTGDLATYSDKK